MKSFTYESMGTHWEISIWDEIDSKKFEQIKREIIQMSNDFDNSYSRFKPDSLVSKISKLRGKIKVPEDFVAMLSIYKDLFNLSDQKLNPLIGQTISDLGYDENYSLKQKSVISPVPNLNTVKIIDETTIQTDKSYLFDFGALGKGYFVDKIRDYLNKQKIKRFLVNGSGDIYYQGDETINAGLEDPKDPGKVIGILNMKSGALCASANNRRRWGNYSHTLDPQTLKTDHEIVATWVAADSCALADALATCLFMVAPVNFEKKYKFEYLIMNRNRKIKKSSGFNAELY